MKDFRTVSFESLFNADLDYESLEIIKNKLAENQLLRCNQLIQNTKLTSDRIINSIETYSNNWSYARIGKVEKCTLTLGISELIMNSTLLQVDRYINSLMFNFDFNFNSSPINSFLI